MNVPFCSKPSARRIGGAVAALVFSALALAIEPAAAPSLRTLLTPEEFQRAGLSKLTAEELDFLSARLLGHPVAFARASESAISTLPQGDAAFGQEAKLHARVDQVQKIPSEILTRVVGHFRGWDGHTVFKLANGQTWRQAEPAVFAADLQEPEITIRKGMFGVYFLRVAGYGSQLKVVRVN